MHQHWFAADSNRLSRVLDRAAEVGDLVDQVQVEGLFARPDPAVGYGLDIRDFSVTSVGHRVHELAVHVVDQTLHVHPLGGGKFAGGIAGIFEFADFQELRLELRPAHEVAIVHPLGNHADGADYAAVVGVNFVGGRGNVVSAAGAHGFNRGHDALLLLVADALDFAIDFFRRSHAAARRIHVNNDRLDGIVVGKTLQLADDFVGIKNHAVEINDADLVSEGVEPGLLLVRVHCNINQSKDGQHKEEESASSNDDPKPDARAVVFRHKCASSLAPIRTQNRYAGTTTLNAFRAMLNSTGVLQTYSPSAKTSIGVSVSRRAVSVCAYSTSRKRKCLPK